MRNYIYIMHPRVYVCCGGDEQTDTARSNRAERGHEADYWAPIPSCAIRVVFYSFRSLSSMKRTSILYTVQNQIEATTNKLLIARAPVFSNKDRDAVE